MLTRDRMMIRRKLVPVISRAYQHNRLLFPVGEPLRFRCHRCREVARLGAERLHDDVYLTRNNPAYVFHASFRITLLYRLSMLERNVIVVRGRHRNRRGHRGRLHLRSDLFKPSFDLP